MVVYRELYYASHGWLTYRKWFWGYALLGLAYVVLFIYPPEFLAERIYNL